MKIKIIESEIKNCKVCGAPAKYSELRESVACSNIDCNQQGAVAPTEKDAIDRWNLVNRPVSVVLRLPGMSKKEIEGFIIGLDSAIEALVEAKKTANTALQMLEPKRKRK